MLVFIVIGRSVFFGLVVSLNLGNILGFSIGKFIYIYFFYVVLCVFCLIGGVVCVMMKCILGNCFYVIDS